MSAPDHIAGIYDLISHSHTNGIKKVISYTESWLRVNHTSAALNASNKRANKTSEEKVKMSYYYHHQVLNSNNLQRFVDKNLRHILQNLWYFDFNLRTTKKTPQMHTTKKERFCRRVWRKSIKDQVAFENTRMHYKDIWQDEKPSWKKLNFTQIHQTIDNTANKKLQISLLG